MVRRPCARASPMNGKAAPAAAPANRLRRVKMLMLCSSCVSSSSRISLARDGIGDERRKGLAQRHALVAGQQRDRRSITAIENLRKDAAAPVVRRSGWQLVQPMIQRCDVLVRKHLVPTGAQRI